MSENLDEMFRRSMNRTFLHSINKNESYHTVRLDSVIQSIPKKTIVEVTGTSLEDSFRTGSKCSFAEDIAYALSKVGDDASTVRDAVKILDSACMHETQLDRKNLIEAFTQTNLPVAMRVPIALGSDKGYNLDEMSIDDIFDEVE